MKDVKCAYHPFYASFLFLYILVYKSTATEVKKKISRPNCRTGYYSLFCFRFRIGDIPLGIFEIHKLAEHIDVIAVELFVLLLPLKHGDR